MSNIDGARLLRDEAIPLAIPNQIQQNTNKKKKRYIKFIPRMYWLFYRKLTYFLVLLPSMVPGTTQIVSNFCMGKVVDSLSNSDCVPKITKYSLVILCYGLFSSICSYINYTGWISIGSSIGNKIRSILFKSLMENDVTFFDTHTIGELLTLLSDDAQSVESAFTEAKTSQLRFIGQFLSSIFVSFSINWGLATVTFLSIICSSALMKTFRQISLIYMNKKFSSMSKSVTIADESLSNSRVVFSFNRQSRETERYDDQVNEACEFDKKSRISNGIGFSLAYLLNWSAVIFSLNIGAYFVIKGKMSVGDLFAFTRISFLGSLGLRNLIGTLQQEQKAINASERIFKIADLTPECIGTKTLANFEGRIQFKSVWFKYPTRNAWVLRDVSFKIEPGEIAAFVGHSGSGKSTIVQLLLRFYDVGSGEILFDDVPITELDPRWIHRVVGVVQQDPQLFAMSAKSNIAYSKDGASDDQIVAAARVALADKFIVKLPGGYDANVGEKGGTLSGGQKQRIAIARAVLKDPVVLITDEATSALDSESEALVQQALDKVMLNRTSLIIAHRLGTIRAARNIYVFESGNLVERGTHEELVQLHGHYYNLVQRQLNGMRTVSQEMLNKLAE